MDTMELSTLSTALHFTTVNPSTVEVHAIEDITTPQFCSLYLHAREHLTFQGVTGPHLDL